MAQKKNKNNKSGQLVRQNQKIPNQAKPSKAKKVVSTLGLPVMGAPVAYSSPTLSGQPRVSSNAKCTRIVHRELIGTISGVTTYGVTAYALNPGVAATFPWLTTVANNYEQYMFKALRFHYVTRCATTYTGSVLLSPEYDALDSPPATEIIQAMMEGSVEDVPWRDQVISFSYPDMISMGPRKFIRSGSVGVADLKTYDVGQLFVGLAGCTDTSTIGKLWVEYDVELYVPQNPGTSSVVIGVGSTSLYYLTAVTSVTTATPLRLPFDTAFYNGANLTNAAGIITFGTAGKYAITVQCTFSSTTPTLTTCVLNPWKNSVSITGAGANSDYNGAIGGSQLSTIAYISVAVGDVFDVLVTVGGGGTLTLDSNCSQVMIQNIA